MTEQQEQLTACQECGLYVNSGSYIWYDQHCFWGNQRELRFCFDPVQGEHRCNRDTYGEVVRPNDNKIHHCRVFNKDGHCKHFEQKMKLTACKDCFFYKNTGSEIWYDQYCKFIRTTGQDKHFNPVNGKYEKDKDKDLPHCRDGNKNGYCGDFKPKKTMCKQKVKQPTIKKTKVKQPKIKKTKVKKQSWWVRFFGSRVE